MAGIAPKNFIYPPTLTDADWQKKKGKLGKMTSTGLGAALKKAESLWKKIDLVRLDPASNPSKTREQLAEKAKAAKQEYLSNVQPLMKEMDEVIKAAKDAQTKLNKALTGKSAAKAAADVQKAAETFRVTCKSIDLQPAIDKVLEDIKRKEVAAAKTLVPMLKQFLSSTKTFLAKPSAAEWEDSVKQQGRSVSNSIAQIPAYRNEFWSDWVKFKGFDLSTLKLGDDPTSVAKMVKIVKLAQAQVVEMGKFKPN